MTSQLQQPAPDFRSLLGAAREVLQLEMLDPDQNHQLLTIHEPKSTLGNSERCTLRLQAPRVAPLHALLLRGRQGTFARSWSPDSYLNGQPFQIAQLQHGDRLQLGALEFLVRLELLDDPSAKEPPPDRQQTDVQGAQLQQRIAELEDQLKAAVAELQSLESDRDQWRANAETLTAELAKQRDHLVRLQAERAAQQDALADRTHWLEEEKRKLAGELEQRLEARINQCQQQLDHTCRQTHADRLQLQQQVLALRENCSALQLRIEQTRLQAARLRTSERGRRQSHAQHVQQEIESLRERLQSVQKERESIAAQLGQPSAAAPGGPANADSKQPIKTPPPATGSSDDYFEQAPQPLETVALVQHYVENNPHLEVAKAAEQNPMPHGEAERPRASAGDEAPDGSEKDDEEAIEAYMTQLMDRWRRQQGYRRSTSIKLGKPTKAKKGSAGPDKPRPAVPEKLDLPAMRELANLNTQFALSLSARQRAQNGALRHISLGAIFLLSSQMVFFFSGNLPTMLLTGAIVSMLGLIFLATGIGTWMRLDTLTPEEDDKQENEGQEVPTPLPVNQTPSPLISSLSSSSISSTTAAPDDDQETAADSQTLQSGS